MFCPHCHNKIPDGSNICPLCYSNLAGVKPQQSAAPKDASQPEEKPVRSRSKSGKKPAYTKEIEEMYFGGNISDRCLQILKPLTEVESTLVTEGNAQLVNTIIVACLKQLLDQACADPNLDPDDVNDQLIQMICHVTGVE